MNWKAILQFEHWHLILWGVWVAMFFVLEGLGLARSKEDATLTFVIRNGIPRWVIACALGWLTWHFLVQKP
jgi:predicted small integral membrane protein